MDTGMVTGGNEFNPGVRQGVVCIYLNVVITVVLYGHNADIAGIGAVILVFGITMSND